MLIVRIPFGVKRFGVVDQVPGRGHVATRCFHVAFLPLVPLGTELVSGDRVISLPFSARSFAIAWARIVLVLGGYLAIAAGAFSTLGEAIPVGLWAPCIVSGFVLFLIAMAIDFLTDRTVLAHTTRAIAVAMCGIVVPWSHSPWLLPLGLSLLAIAWWSLGATRASEYRAAELSRLLGISTAPPAARAIRVRRRATLPPLPPLPSAPPPPREPPPLSPRILR